MKITQLPFHPIKLLILGLLFLYACDKSENLPHPEMGLNYFPLKVNATNVYNVDSVVYSDFTNTITTFQFLIKDSVINNFIDIQGNSTYRIERYKKTATIDWTFQKVITRKIIGNRAEEFIDNHRYIRLVFPLTLKSTWNGNLYNSLEEWKHEVIGIDQPLNLTIIKLDSTTTIKQHDEVNLIREDTYTETYAKNVGLVKKEVKAVDKDISTQKIKRGYRYTMQLNSYK